MLKNILLIALLSITVISKAQTTYPTPVESDYIAKDFTFKSGEKLPELRMHCYTIGKPHKNAKGQTDNAVLIMHGTTGSSLKLISIAGFSNTLFSPGGLLDASKYYIVFIDAIGHGKSSKPSDGLHMKFPKYNYDDMVKADYLLVTQHLGINHLRLVMGTSMGGMNTWVWGYTYPDFMDALMPLASNPVEIAGRNRMMRKLAIDLIENDPAWMGGEYKTQPKEGLLGATSSLLFMGSSALQMQKVAPTRAMEDEVLAKAEENYYKILDANDVIYAMDASKGYDPSPHLGQIKAPLFAINSADDVINPPEMGMIDREIKKVPHGRYILLPITSETNGHPTHSIPSIWGHYLKELLALSEKP
ncbi:MAG TPA: alpha/beta fold hydrolase [Mucilaginibacter sp.]|jgi:homoserine O-acetyltransferase|nr:alpha/beta fold hydrolase [Mucilaginibacter sp.]